MGRRLEGGAVRRCCRALPVQGPSGPRLPPGRRSVAAATGLLALVGAFSGGDAGFDRARDALANGFLGVADVEVLIGCKRDVLQRDVGDRAVGQAVNDAGVARAFDCDVIDEDVANRGNLRRVAA